MCGMGRLFVGKNRKRTVSSLTMNVNEESHIVEIWLTNAEKTSETVCQRLKPIFSVYKKQGCLEAEFESGQPELAGLTFSLMCEYRTGLALEVEPQGFPCGSIFLLSFFDFSVTMLSGNNMPEGNRYG